MTIDNYFYSQFSYVTTFNVIAITKEKKNNNKDKLKPFDFCNQLYLPNMWLKFLVNWIKIEGFRALRRGPEN